MKVNEYFLCGGIFQNQNQLRHQTPTCLDDCRKVPVLGEYLMNRGLSRSLVEKIFWQNALEFAQKNWQ